ncbi:MAG TPA: hypothetical protein VKR32_12070 [Puia sp.]|nr:hypothetical protein [Puia sp.]
MKLALYSRKDLAWDAGTPKAQESATEFSVGYNVRKQEEVDALMELARKAGAKIVKPPEKAFGVGITVISKTPMVICGKWPGLPSLSPNSPN